MPTSEQRCWRSMRGQRSLITRRQAIDAGLTGRQVAGRLQRGLWVPVHRGVYRLAASPENFEQSVLAACLAVDGFASGATAGALYGLRRCEPGPLEVTVVSDRRAHLQDVAVLRRPELDSADRARMAGIPTVSPGRALVDLALRAPDRLESAYFGALHRGLTRRDLIGRALRRASPRDRVGARALQALLADEAPPTESELEDDFLNLVLRAHGLPEPERQIPVAGGRYRLDFGWSATKSAAEVDGAIAHSTPGERRRDRDKTIAARSEGWHVERVRWDDVHTWPEVTAGRFRALLGEQAA